MLNKEKITRVDIYDKNGNRIISTKSFTFPRDFFKIRGLELVVVKCAGLPVLSREDPITAVFEYVNGTRIQCVTKVDISTEEQLNFHVDDGIVLEERRNSFKVKTDTEVLISCLDRDGEKTEFDPPIKARLLNINLGGVLMNCSEQLVPDDVITLLMLDETIALQTKILRIQLDNNGDMIGYGCQFMEVSHGQEEKIARFIFEKQLEERERLKKNSSR
ncbi:MAG: PilZ domain-containing protein [Huintestinicola sp.]